MHIRQSRLDLLELTKKQEVAIENLYEMYNMCNMSKNKFPVNVIWCSGCNFSLNTSYSSMEDDSDLPLNRVHIEPGADWSSRLILDDAWKITGVRLLLRVIWRNTNWFYSFVNALKAPQFKWCAIRHEVKKLSPIWEKEILGHGDHLRRVNQDFFVKK